MLGYSSADGMRAFRIQYKPKKGMWRANFQEKVHMMLQEKLYLIK